MLYTMTHQSALGDIVLLCDETYLLGLWFKGQKYFGANYQLEEATVAKSRPINLAMTWLDQYFSEKNSNVDMVPIKPEVTDFRKAVFQALESIPYGATVTYKQISDQLQKGNKYITNKSRAIGNAVGHNPILLLIPCHRVVGSDGALTGYAGGIDRKKALLTLEKQIKH